MERAAHLPANRILALDERGVGLRATWHLDRGFINLSLWRGDRCTETFHLAPGEAARLVEFVVHGLARATAPHAGPARLRVVPDAGAAGPAPAAPMRQRLLAELRDQAARALEGAAQRIRQERAPRTGS